MADSGQKTEQPTPRRLERARREGNFPSSREFASAIVFFGFAGTISWFGGFFLLRVGHLMRTLLTLCFNASELTPVGLAGIARNVIAPELMPLSMTGAAILLLAAGVQLATTRAGLSFQKLTPDFQRLNQFRRLASLPAQNGFCSCKRLRSSRW